MRHRKKSEKFSRSRAQRKALVKSLTRALLAYEAIKTTESKAKGVRRWVDRLIEWGKDDTLHNRRLAYKFLCDHKLVKKLFEDIAPRYKDVCGGYTRIIDLGNRKGDGAKISLLELTKRKPKEKPKKKEAKQAREKKEEVVSQKEEVVERKEPKQKSFLEGVKKIFKRE